MKWLAFSAAVAAAMTLSACISDLTPVTDPDQLVDLTFEAFVDPEVKTILSDGANVLWLPGDKISISGASEAFLSDATEASALTQFTGKAPADDKWYAVYPYELVKGWNGTVATIELPSVQDFVDGSFANGLSIMTASTTKSEKSLSFRNVLSFLKFTIGPESAGITDVILSGNAGEMMTGTITVDCSAGIPEISTVSDGSTEAKIHSETPLAAGTYYIAVIPRCFEKGITLEFRDAEARSFKKTISASVTFKRNTIMNGGTINVVFEEEPASLRDILMELYNATAGASWTNNTNWGSSQPLSEWYGVTLSGDNLSELDLRNNNLTGSLPGSIAELICPGVTIYLYNNNLSGQIPEELKNHHEWKNQWMNFMWNNSFDLETADIPVPGPFTFTDIDGTAFTSENLFAENKIIAFYQFRSDYDHYGTLLQSYYEQYGSQGFEVLGAMNGADATTAGQYKTEKGYTWIVGLTNWSNSLRSSTSYSYDYFYPVGIVPTLTLFDCEKRQVIFSDLLESTSGLDELLANKFGKYESTDFSANGKVHTLQTATEGNGIEIVLMGDAFSDRLIADGTYEQRMKEAAEAFFIEEPYKSYRHLFNIRYVDVVSKNEIYGGQTALEGYFGEGTHVGGNDSKCREYALKAISDTKINEAMIVVVMNRVYYAGTCYMYYSASGNDWSSGASISYFPLGRNGEMEILLNHETCGHGFAKLADEYFYDSMGTIPAANVATYTELQSYGWYKNVDFTNDPAKVKWAKFLTDDRFSGQGLGIYEGGCTYPKGVWKSTEESIMNKNTGGFNAPSREAIWYRIHKLAYGADWEYDFEKFVEFDTKSRAASATAVPFYLARPSDLKPLDPPVVIHHPL